MSDQEEITETPEEPEVVDADPADDTAYLPRIIANEFGMTEGNAWEMVAGGELEIDEEKWTEDKMHLPIDRIDGKSITVRGTVRTVTFKYTRD